jgi:RNA polymerase sigma factor (sigma-70 family)
VGAHADPSLIPSRYEERPLNAVQQARGVESPVGFEDVFRRRYAELHSLGYRLLGDAGEAEDVVQDVFLKLAGSELLDRPGEEIAAWLRRVCINASYNRLRGLKRAAERMERAARLEPPEAAGDVPQERVLESEERQAVRSALGAVPERQRACLLLRHSGYSYAEIAATLEIAVGSVGVLLSRAERTFRDNFQEHPYALP